MVESNEGVHMFTTVAQLDDIPEGSLLGVEAEGQEIVLANVDGTIYAVQDRCAHANAPLSKGKLVGSTIICPMHFAQFDVTTGAKIKDPNMNSPDMEELGVISKEMTCQSTISPASIAYLAT